MPLEYHVYGLLTSFVEREYKKILSDLRDAKVRFTTGEDIRAKKGILKRLFAQKDPAYVFVADVNFQQVTNWYMNYFGWQVNPFRFLVSEKPLDDWVEKFLYLQRNKLGKEFLRQVGSYVTNHWEHGLEIISLDQKAGVIEAEARELSRKLNLPLEIREKGVP